MARKNLIIYNLETDSNSLVLATAVEWIRELSYHFEKVMVFSTHTGNYDLPGNVVVTEVGGGSYIMRIRSLYRLFKSTSVVTERQDWTVFHHMSSKTLAILGPIYRIYGVRQVLWYSHNHKPGHLKATYNFANAIVCPTGNSFPIASTKVRAIGHAIPFPKMKLTKNQARNGIVHVGRLVRVKHIEDLINEVSKLPKNIAPKISLIGPAPDDSYRSQIIERMENQLLEYEVIPPLHYLELRESLGKFKFCYTGTPKSVDKAALEAAISGCFVVTNSHETLDLTGMSEVWKHLEVKQPISLADQIMILSSLTSDVENSLRELLSITSINNNGIQETIERLVTILSS